MPHEQHKSQRNKQWMLDHKELRNSFVNRQIYWEAYQSFEDFTDISRKEMDSRNTSMYRYIR